MEIKILGKNVCRKEKKKQKKRIMKTIIKGQTKMKTKKEKKGRNNLLISNAAGVGHLLS